MSQQPSQNLAGSKSSLDLGWYSWWANQAAGDLLASFSPLSGVLLASCAGGCPAPSPGSEAGGCPEGWSSCPAGCFSCPARVSQAGVQQEGILWVVLNVLLQPRTGSQQVDQQNCRTAFILLSMEEQLVMDRWCLGEEEEKRREGGGSNFAAAEVTKKPKKTIFLTFCPQIFRPKNIWKKKKEWMGQKF